MHPRRATPLLALLLAGCHGAPSENPISWWHGLQGGVIAEQRPPPPGANQPYPNLATIPPRPPMPNPAAQQQISSRLMLAQVQAEQQATANPLPPPKPAAPAQHQPPPAPATNSDGATATLAAASAPPPPPPSPAASAAAPVILRPAAGGSGNTIPAGTLPPIPDAPPPPPSIGGIAVPARTAPQPALPPPPPLPPSKPGEYVWIPFAPDSAVVTADAERSLRSLATRRHGTPIALVGHGDATSDAAAVQGAALALGLKRARAMADVLAAAGVPAGALQMSAAAFGRGGDARLVD